MILSKKSLFIRWAYLPEFLLQQQNEIPTHTNLCSAFWRCLTLVPMFIIAFGSAVIIFSPIWIPIWAFCKLEDNGKLKWATKKRKAPDIFIIASAKVSDWKNKTCTIIEIKD